MEYIQLVGAESVQQAANSMREAAEQMNRAAAEFQWAVDNQKRFMDEWLQTFERVLTDHK